MMGEGKQSENQSGNEAGDLGNGAGAAGHQADAADDAENDCNPFGGGDHLSFDSLRCLAKRAGLGKSKDSCEPRK